MTALFSSFMRIARQITAAETKAIHTDNQIVYRIPIMTTEKIKIKEIVSDSEGFTLIANFEDSPKLAPVAASPLDAYRGSGRHSSHQKKLTH